ncbi:MAG: hypothetical protein ABI051_12260 [Vicinamibacterales bacterium]
MMRRTMKKTALIGAAAFLLAGAGLLAHEQTYKGTVMTVEAANVQVKVLDDTTKKETPMVFVITTKTKVFRGEKTVSFAAAHIQKDERVAVTVDHDAGADKATVIRLAAQK